MMKNVTRITDQLATQLSEMTTSPMRGVVAVRAPARTEIAGNHTDHEGGRVIAGAINRCIEGLAVGSGERVIRVQSEGFDPIAVRLDRLGPRKEEQGSPSALVRGMAAQMMGTGRRPEGLNLVLTSDIPAGGGLSSSAAFELALCRVMEALWPGKPVSAVEAARMAWRAERDWFGKPCGLMDQLAVSLGGLACMDFEWNDPSVERMRLDFYELGYTLCLTNVGCDHSAYTDEYAAIPTDMGIVARRLGGRRLCEVSEDALIARVDRLRAEVGDRAVLRALHYWNEMGLVDARWVALRRHDMEDFLDLTRRSGASSGMFLQNVSVGGSQRQDAMVAIALSERLLRGRGATRIHGGGFGGSVQAFVPSDLVESYVRGMDACLGEGSCETYALVDEGAQAMWV